MKMLDGWVERTRGKETEQGTIGVGVVLWEIETIDYLLRGIRRIY